MQGVPDRPLLLVLGIRPDVIRASLLITMLKERLGKRFVFAWSGQHYSDNLKDVFFRELSVPMPDVELGASGSSDAEVAVGVVTNLGDYLDQNPVHSIVFLGDTNTVLGSIAASIRGIPILHIEGCMRSYDWRMPEERNRTIIDHISDRIYAYLTEYKDQGIDEGIPEDRILVTGNPIVDVVQRYFQSGSIRLPRSQAQELFSHVGVVANNFVLMTCHRRENVSRQASLNNIMRLAALLGEPVVFPASYRTQRELVKHKIAVPDCIRLLDPIGYVQFLELLAASNGVLTDSGTVVEEACVLGVPSIQMRTSTERPQVYDVGSSIRFDPHSSWNLEDLRCVVQRFGRLRETRWEQPFGDGFASQRIADDLVSVMDNLDFSGHQPHALSRHHMRAFSGTLPTAITGWV